MISRYRLHALVGLAVLLAWLNLRSPAVVAVVPVTERTNAATQSAQRPSQQPVSAPLPTELTRPTLEPARRDPFALETPLQPAPVKQVAPPPVLEPTPPPAPPPLNLKFTGRMTAPDGSQTIYAAYGDTTLAITAGQTLPNGYRVDAITARAVELSYPSLNTTARLDLPEPPRYEIR